MFNHCCKLTSTPFTWTTSSLHGTKYKLTVSLLKKWMIGWPWTYSWSWLYVLYWLSPNPDHMVTQIAALDWLFKSGYITEPRDSSPRLTLYHPTCILACDAAQLKTFLSTPQTQACSNHRTLVKFCAFCLNHVHFPLHLKYEFSHHFLGDAFLTVWSGSGFFTKDS